MQLLEFYPPPAELISSELGVLRFLMTNTYITEMHATFAENAKRDYNRNKSKPIGFDFFSYFDVYHSEMPGKALKPNLRLVVAALIQLNGDRTYSNVSYCLAVCRRKAKFPILRKFHFDVTVTNRGGQPRRQQHPVCHIQYCGEMIPGMNVMGCQDEQLKQMHPSLSEPRVFFWPMSLALLIDMALHEFPDRHSLSFRGSSEWRGIVRKQESLVLRPFYQKCVQITGNAPGNDRILSDEFYVS